MQNSMSEPPLHPCNQGFQWKRIRGPFRIVTEEQARSYNERGFFLLADVLNRDSVAEITAAIDPLESKGEEFLRRMPDKRLFIAEADGITFTVHLVKLSPMLREFSASRLFVDLCSDLIGPDVRLYWDQAVYKKPEYPKPFPWHQDNGYTYIEPQAYLTCWIALTDATVKNGCPWVIPGGHLRGTLAHRASPLGYVCREENGPEAVPIEARAGSIVVFSSLTPHRTGPNTTKDVRKTYILQYAPDGARVVETGALCDAPDRQYLIAKGGRASVAS